MGFSKFESMRQESDLVVDASFLPDGILQPILFEPSEDPLPQGQQPPLPNLLERVPQVVFRPVGALENPSPQRIAVLFSGGPAPGGHNVLLGLFTLLHEMGHTLLGVRRGPKGLLSGDLFEISQSAIGPYQNTGGFDFLGSDRTKIKTPEQFEQVRSVVKAHRLNGLVIIGGDDSNTNAAFLAEALLDLNCAVVGVPKTIDGDVQVSDYLPISFGFDTATRVYAEMVGNLLKDTASAHKYWHFVKVMGRSASHIAMQVGALTEAPLTLISEEVKAKNMGYQDVVEQIASVMLERNKLGLPFGVVVIPEGIIEFIPDFLDQLSPELRERLSTDLDAHGNPKLSHIDCEDLLAQSVSEYLNEKGFTPKILTHFYGYEGRSAAPTPFDANLTYHLGLGAASLVLGQQTGVMIGVTKTESGWVATGLPLTALMAPVERAGETHFVIEKVLVDLEGEAFKQFSKDRVDWVKQVAGISPGPIQYS